MFEIDGVTEEQAREAMRLAMHKLSLIHISMEAVRARMER